MIITLALTFLIYVLGVVFALFPVVTQLPGGSDPYFVQGIGIYRELATFFPPLNLFLELTAAYLTYKIGMILLKFFLGHRTPTLQ